MSERLYWLGFSIAKGFGPVRVRLMLDHFGSLRNAWQASIPELSQIGIDKRTLSSLETTRSHLDLSKELRRLDDHGIALLTWQDDAYPRTLAQLRPIDHAPHVLYIRGTLAESDDWALAVVGTRNISAYGRQVTHQLVTELARQGITIVSGMARGVDAVAHQAALNAGARTIGVLGCGLDTIYPPENKHLAAEIVRNGALISRFPLGIAPEAKNFAPRNRILSGLARGVLVTEAGTKSGALSTARQALEQGREVFAVPGNITAHGSSGTNSLIQDGANPALTAKDILDVLDVEYVTEYVSARRALPNLDEDETHVLNCLTQEPTHVDEIVHTSGLPTSQVSTALMKLQLKGMVREVGHMTFVSSG